MAHEDCATDLARLVAEHHQPVYRYAFRLTGSAADAEDLTQQVFLIAHQKGWQVREKDSLRAWLFTVLRNCFLKGRRKRSPTPAANLELSLESVPERIPEEQEIDSDELQRALDSLPPRYRLVVAMFYYEGLAYREIAEKLGLPIGTVMSRLARAKSHLRQALFEPGETESTSENSREVQEDQKERKTATTRQG